MSVPETITVRCLLIGDGRRVHRLTPNEENRTLLDEGSRERLPSGGNSHACILVFSRVSIWHRPHSFEELPAVHFFFPTFHLISSRLLVVRPYMVEVSTPEA
jgi:hypothetical protein